MQYPKRDEYADYYQLYVGRVPEGDILEQLRNQGEELQDFLAGLSEDYGNHRYAEGKWSVKEVLGHLADTERIFAARALVMSRGDTTPQPNIDQDVLVAGSGAARRSLARLAAEMRAVRAASLALFESFDAEQEARVGSASGYSFTARSLAWIISGHELHHRGVIEERYLG